MKYLETIKIKSVSGDGEIEGYASVFNETDIQGDIVVKNAFAKTIADWNNGKVPKLLWQHDVATPIGIIEELFEDDYGLFVKARLLLEIPKAKEVYTLLKSRAIDGFSIGYRIRDNYIQNGRNYLTDLELLEISVVTFPACESATVENIKMNNVNEKRNKNMTKNLPLSINTKEEDTNFADYIRKGVDSFFTKSMTETADKDGAVLLPSSIVKRIEEKLNFLSPMRSICRTMNVSTNSVDIIIDSNLPDAGWTAENDVREETDSPELEKIRIPVHELYAKPKAHQHLLDDAQINVEEWLLDKITEKFASLEDWAFINGVGNDKPHGFLKYPSENNKKRPSKTFEHFCTGANGAFLDNDHALDVLIDMVCSIKPVYVKNAKWIMSRSALAQVRKIKNKDGMPIWMPSVAEGAPATLLGYPVIIDDNMPELVPNTESVSIAFGDFSSAYQIVDRQELSVLRDPYTSKPFVEFYVSKRTGGDVVDFEAIKLLKFSVK